MELKIIWEIICRRKWIIIQAFLIISLTAIIGTFLLPPVYETSAKVHIKTSDSESSLLAAIGLKGITLTGKQRTETDTRMALVTVAPALDKVISRLQLRSRDGHLMKIDELMKSNFILSKIFPEPYLEIKQVEETDLIEIKASSCDPQEAAMIANTVAEVYIEENLKQRKEEYRSAEEFIEDRIVLVKAEYLKLLEEIRKFQITEKTVDLETETKAAIDKMAELMKKKEEIVISLAEVSAKTKTLEAQLSKENETTVSSSAISENPLIENLKKTLNELELELSGTLTEKRPNHPDVIILKQQIMRTREELRKEVGIFQKSSPELNTLERELSALKAHLKGINVDIDKCTAILYSLPDKAFTRSQLELKLSASQKLYSSLLECLYQVGIAEAMTLSDIRLVDPAIAPEIYKPETPNKVLNGIMGIFLGLTLGFGLAFLVDYLDDTIKMPDEVKAYGLAVLGMIPKIKKKNGLLISHADPKGPVPEAYRTVRNNIKFACLDKPCNSLLITSSIDGEGKSTSAANLAISLAFEGKRVLLMDTDFRKPTIHEMFQISNSIGITNVLAGGTTIEDAIRDTEIEGLSVLTSGLVPIDPGRLIESERMRQLTKEVGQAYDVVIFDSHPILYANDAIVIAGYADASILIVESKRTLKRLLTQSAEHFSRANIQPLGAIVNKFTAERGSKYYHSSYYYYYSS